MSENEGKKGVDKEDIPDIQEGTTSKSEMIMSTDISPLSDEAKMREIDAIYKEVFDSLKSKSVRETEPILELSNLLKKISSNVRKYKKEGMEDKSYLDDAYEDARLALIKKNTIIREKPKGLSLERFSIMGGLVWVLLGWVILRLIFGFFYSNGVFLLDTFFVAFIAAMVSAIIYLGRSVEFEVDTFKAFATITASPFVAVALIVIFSELAIGVGGQLTTAGASSDIITFTLKGASSELKLGFAFMFGFFGEISIEILKNVMKSVTGRG